LARGLTWSLRGFGTAHRMTGEDAFPASARLCADFELQHMPFDGEAPGGPGVPPNDYDDPRRPVLYDSSAAALAASGLLQLGELEQDMTRSERCRNAAMRILQTQCGHPYPASATPAWEGIPRHGVCHRPKGLGVDEDGMCGEYFFVKTLQGKGVL